MKILARESFSLFGETQRSQRASCGTRKELRVTKQLRVMVQVGAETDTEDLLSATIWVGQHSEFRVVTQLRVVVQVQWGLRQTFRI